MPVTHKDQELLQVPPVGSDASIRLATLLALEVAKLLHQVGELLGHGIGPPARATTTLSPIGSIGRDYPRVKSLGQDGGCPADRDGAVGTMMRNAHAVLASGAAGGEAVARPLCPAERFGARGGGNRAAPSGRRGKALSSVAGNINPRGSRAQCALESPGVGWDRSPDGYGCYSSSSGGRVGPLNPMAASSIVSLERVLLQKPKTNRSDSSTC